MNLNERRKMAKMAKTAKMAKMAKTVGGSPVSLFTSRDGQTLLFFLICSRGNCLDDRYNSS